ncbi:uncharacterized protein LOC122333280 [Puntigrus tetrazona]|uniref:uncharacterized protein LOC122333280 n=1 Tax=Puntigrus tetrazona TaxID=1606681 RepID=UPI001C8AE33D|nr:uncharacterized protein LOC122333280 [Puntigrus tetrazona]
MWQGILAISDYKPNPSTPTAPNVFFLNELNDFYTRFERDNNETVTKITPSSDPPITLTSSEVYAALSRINARKAAGPDAFNTVIPSKLITKLRDLDINISLCNWVMDFLTNRPQHIRPVFGSISIVKIADDTTVIGLISNNNETAYREEVQDLVLKLTCCKAPEFSAYQKKKPPKSYARNHHFHKMLFNRAVKMACVVRYGFLLIGICLRSTSFASSLLQVTSLMEAVGNNIIIRCSADKTSQDGVYMYKQVGASKNKQEVFYYYKDGTFQPKSIWCKEKVQLYGTYHDFNVTVSNVNTTDSGFYWCEFNLEDKNRIFSVTWLQIEELVDTKTNKAEEVDEKVCPEDVRHEWILVCVITVCVVMLFISIIFVILKVKGCLMRKKYKTSTPPSDSVYEEMKQRNLVDQPSALTFINPEYQSCFSN